MALLKDLRELFSGQRGRKKAPAPAPVPGPDPNRGATIGADLARRPREAMIAPERNEWVASLREGARKIGRERAREDKFTHTGWGFGPMCDTASLLEQRLLSPCGRYFLCADGFQMGVIAGEGYYSSPEAYPDSPEGTWPGPWASMEVRVPRRQKMPRTLQALRPYLDPYGNNTEYVAAYVPFKVVVDIIDSHGGFYNGPSSLTPDFSQLVEKLEPDE